MQHFKVLVSLALKPNIQTALCVFALVHETSSFILFLLKRKMSKEIKQQQQAALTSFDNPTSPLRSSSRKNIRCGCQVILAGRSLWVTLEIQSKLKLRTDSAEG